MALGATRERIAVESARPVAALSAIGALAGLVIFLLAKAAVESVVAPPPDAAPPAAWLVAAITLGLMAAAIVLACYSPIRIATETDPAISLRES
jgi:ABC-type antimicrobial peptide transport system permease subunit